MRMIAEHYAFEIEVLRRPAHDGKVEGQVPKGGDRLLAVAYRKPQLDLGMKLPECRQSLRSKIFRGANDAGHDAAAFSAFEPRNLLVAFGKQRLDPVCRPKQNLTSRRGDRAFAQTLDERQAGLFLKLLHFNGNCRRGNMKLPR